MPEGLPFRRSTRSHRLVLAMKRERVLTLGLELECRKIA